MNVFILKDKTILVREVGANFWYKHVMFVSPGRDPSFPASNTREEPFTSTVMFCEN